MWHFGFRNETYCPYCLIFAAILVFLFLFNSRRSRLPLMGIGVALGFLLCLLFFKGAASPVYADEVLLPSFGQGKVQVRLYTDYFCGPCSHMEPKIEPLLKDLVQRDVHHPHLHRHAGPYAYPSLCQIFSLHIQSGEEIRPDP